MRTTRLAMICVLAGVMTLPGCVIGNLLGGMAQNAEYQKLIQVLPEYDGLEDKSVAVIVNTDLSTLYEYPQVARQIAAGISLNIQRAIPSARVMNPDKVIAWQFNTAQWSAMPYGDLAARLQVDRIVYVDMYEYRLHPPGNSWIYEGVCAATIGVIERDNFDPDSFAHAMSTITTFPDLRNLTRDEATPERVQLGLLAKFIQDTSRLFYEHIRPKYPDKYQGPKPVQKS